MPLSYGRYGQRRDGPWDTFRQLHPEFREPENLAIKVAANVAGWLMVSAVATPLALIALIPKSKRKLEAELVAYGASHDVMLKIWPTLPEHERRAIMCGASRGHPIASASNYRR